MTAHHLSSLLVVLVLALGGSAACASRLASPESGPPPVIPQPPREGVLPYEAVAPKPEPSLPRSVALPSPEAVPLPAGFHPRHLFEGDRAGPDARAAVELFELALASPQPPPETPLVGALFACRARGIDPKHRFDWFGKPELLVRLTLGSTPMASRSSKQDRPVRIFTVPGVAIKKGEGLRLEVWDRDVTDKELMARREPIFDGKLPLKISARNASLECAVVPAAEVDARAVAARGHTDAALGRLERQQQTNAPEVDWGYPREQTADALRSLRRFASMWGWAHPEVQVRTRRLEHWRERWDLAARAHVDEFLRRLPAAGEWLEPDPAFSLQVASWSCETPDRGTCPSGIDCDRDCTITLEVKNLSEAPWVPGGSHKGLGRLGIPWAVLEDGSTRSASLKVIPRMLEVEATDEQSTPEPEATTVVVEPGAVGQVEVRFSLLRGRRPAPRLLWFTSTDLLLALVPAPAR